MNAKKRGAWLEKLSQASVARPAQLDVQDSQRINIMNTGAGLSNSRQEVTEDRVTFLKNCLKKISILV